MKKLRKYIAIILIAGAVLLALGYVFYYSGFRVICDGLALHLHQIFEQQMSTEPKISFANAIDENTEILDDCIVVNYSKIPQTDVHEWLRKYEIEKYNVEYKCDILSFSLVIYKLGNKFYTLSYSMGPCSGENVYFDQMPEHNSETWYRTRYSLENSVISDHLNNRAFCTALEQNVGEKDGIQCK
jgi:hypothetical protein